MSGSVKSIRHHQSFAGRDADDAHEQYLRIVDHEGGGSSVHNDLTGRDSATAHTQYLRLAETGRQTVHDLQAYAFEALAITTLNLGPETLSCSDLYIMGSGGSCAEDDYSGGDIYIKTMANHGDNCYGNIHITTDTVLGESGNIYLEGYCLELIFGGNIDICGDSSLCMVVPNMLYLSGDCIFLCADGKVCIEGDLCVDGDLFVDGNIEGGDWHASYGSLYLGQCGRTVLCLSNQADNFAEAECAIIAFCGLSCDAFADCTIVWDGAITGENQAKYCLKGGIFIDVNGCQRYIKFHKALA